MYTSSDHPVSPGRISSDALCVCMHLFADRAPIALSRLPPVSQPYLTPLTSRVSGSTEMFGQVNGILILVPGSDRTRSL
jgi:hypothetical protein